MLEEPPQDVEVQRGADARDLPRSPDADTQSKAVKKSPGARSWEHEGRDPGVAGWGLEVEHFELIRSQFLAAANSWEPGT